VFKMKNLSLKSSLTIATVLSGFLLSHHAMALNKDDAAALCKKSRRCAFSLQVNGDLAIQVGKVLIVCPKNYTDCRMMRHTRKGHVSVGELLNNSDANQGSRGGLGSQVTGGDGVGFHNSNGGNGSGSGGIGTNGVDHHGGDGGLH
jgi:hypothetical protein